MFYYGGIPFLTGVGVMLALVAYLSLYPALFGAVVSGMRKGAYGADRLVTPLGPVYAASLFTALEYLRGNLFTGFPWSLVGYTQAMNTPLVQISDITGVWGLTALVVFVNAGLYRLSWWALNRDTRPPVVEVLAPLVILTLAFSYGSMRIKQVDREVAGWRPLRAAVTQGNIDQSLKWDKTFQHKTLEIYRDLTLRAAAEGARLVIWPETAVPYYFGENPANDAFISRAVKESGAHVLTGSPAFGYDSRTRILNYFNSAYLLGPDGGISGRYDKVHLVPFGEYVPLKRFLPFIRKLTEGVGDFKSGPGPVPIEYEGGSMGVLICYEAIFPELSRGAIRNGAGLLVNITNDAWFGKTSAPYQHFEMSVVRAVENRAFLLRAANTGISAVVDPAGRVLKETMLFETTLLVDDVALKEGGLTFYTRHGDVFAYACIVVSIIFLATLRIRRSADVR
jgi:apolipoprotein N-acyltransferase